MTDKFKAPTQCPKCSGTVEAGAYIGSNVSSAQAGMNIEGTPSALKWWKVQTREQKGILSGRVTKGLALVLPQGGPITVLQYRCVECGFLESYAPDPVE